MSLYSYPEHGLPQRRGSARWLCTARAARAARAARTAPLHASRRLALAPPLTPICLHCPSHPSTPPPLLFSACASRSGSAKGKAKPSPSAAADDDGFQTAGKAGSKKGRGKKGSLDPSLLGFSVESSRIMQGEIDLPQ